MAAVWILLAKTRFPAHLIESSREHGVRTVSVPFDISADYLPDLLRRPDEELQRLSAGLPPEAPEFDQIIHRGHAMKRLILLARRVAPRSVPVLIEGETGTGKELLARAIHLASPRLCRCSLITCSNRSIARGRGSLDSPRRNFLPEQETFCSTTRGRGISANC